jgi:hypothetical protein
VQAGVRASAISSTLIFANFADISAFILRFGSLSSLQAVLSLPSESFLIESREEAIKE